MARLFLRLKLTLLAASLRAGWRQRIGLVAALIVAVPVSVGGFAALAWLGGATAGGTGLTLVLALLLVLWLVGPPLTFGLDETLDPARLRLLPLSRGELAAGLITASAVGVGPLVTLAVLSGAVAGFGTWGLTGALVGAGVLLHALLCVVAARALTTVLSGWLRSRRGQDVLVVAGAVTALGFAAASQVPNLLADVLVDPEALRQGLERAEAVLAVTPAGWAAAGVIAAADGRPGAALGWLAATAVLVAGLTWLWIASLERSADAGPASGRRADRGLFTGLARLLPRSRLGASAARELRYQWRVPQLRVQWLLLPLLAGGLVVAALVVPGGLPRLSVFAVCGLVTLHAFSLLNAFGADRAAVWQLLAVDGITRDDLAGKNLAGAMMVAPVAFVLAVVLALLTGGWPLLAPALLTAAALLGVAYGVGDVVSVLAPAALPESTGNVWAGATGTGCATALLQAAGVVAGGLLLAPAAVGVAGTVTLAPRWTLAATAAAAAYGIGVWRAGLGVAARLAASRGPEILDALRART